MRADRFRALLNIVASTLAEAGEAPEGILYAGLMHAGITIGDYENIREMLVALGLATMEPGPMLKATAKLTEAYREVMAKSAGRPSLSRNGPSGGDIHDTTPS